MLRFISLAVFWGGMYFLFLAINAWSDSYFKGELFENPQNIIGIFQLAIGLFLTYMGVKFRPKRVIKLAMFDGETLYAYPKHVKKPLAIQVSEIDRLELVDDMAFLRFHKYDDIGKMYPVAFLYVVKRSQEKVQIAKFYSWTYFPLSEQKNWEMVEEEARRASKGLAKAIDRSFRVGKK
ncbi:MAG: hypothetical protein AB8F95_14650 [Bacteroidia bacterium]